MSRQLWIILPMMLVGCASQPEHPVYDSPDPGESIWEDYADQIALLGKPGTPKTVWDQTTDPEYIRQLKGEAEVREILDRYENISEEEMKHFIRLFHAAESTFHYGLEGNFKALVFFDEGGLTLDAVLMSN